MTNYLSLKIIHVEDNPADRNWFAEIAKEIRHIELLGSFETTEVALDFLSKNRVDVAILDVEMSGSNNGLWLADKIKYTDTKVVFLTAHPDYAVKAFEACALHYLIKPVSKDALANAMDRFQKPFSVDLENESNVVHQGEKIAELISNYMTKQSHPKRIFINNLHKTTILHLSQVIYITSKGAYSEFITSEGQKHTSSKNLKFFDDVLANHLDFVRIHRGSIINKNYLKAILREPNALKAQMSDGNILEISLPRREEIIEKLKA